MIETKNIKISNAHRQEKRNRQKEKLNHWTPEKYLDPQSTCRTFERLEKKFGYNYDFNNSKTLKYMKEQFMDHTFSYLGKGEWTKKLGRKDKYERNLELGKPLRQNPLFKIFNKLEPKLQAADKAFAFQVIKREYC